jgi:hypothetical protein
VTYDLCRVNHRTNELLDQHDYNPLLYDIRQSVVCRGGSRKPFPPPWSSNQNSHLSRYWKKNCSCFTVNSGLQFNSRLKCVAKHRYICIRDGTGLTVLLTAVHSGGGGASAHMTSDRRHMGHRLNTASGRRIGTTDERRTSHRQISACRQDVRGQLRTYYILTLKVQSCNWHAASRCMQEMEVASLCCEWSSLLSQRVQCAVTAAVQMQRVLHRNSPFTNCIVTHNKFDCFLINR